MLYPPMCSETQQITFIVNQTRSSVLRDVPIGEKLSLMKRIG